MIVCQNCFMWEATHGMNDWKLCAECYEKYKNYNVETGERDK